MSDDKNVSIGVIGIGSMAVNVHLPCLFETPGVKVCSLCDVIYEKAEKTAAKYMIPGVYNDYRQMIKNEKLDAVFILVQPDQTFRITVDCIKKGLDVFIEKPPGITTFQAKTIAEYSKKYNRIVQVGFNRRYIPIVQNVVDIMKRTTVINQVEGCFFKNGDASFYDGCADALVCDTIHAIDLVRSIAAGSPKEVASIKSCMNSSIINSWNSLILFDNQITGIIKANYQTGGRVHNFEIHGPEASAYINLGFGCFECEAKILYFGGKGTHSISANGSGEYEVCRIGSEDIKNGKSYRFYGFLDSCMAFVKAVRERNQPLTNIDDAIKTMELVDLIAASGIKK